MPLIDVDIDSVPDKIPPIAPGIYEGTMVEPPIDKESKKGRPMFELTLRITKSRSPEGENDVNKTIMDWIMKDDERGQSRFRTLCLSGGQDPKDVNENGWSALLGESITFRVRNDDRDGELRASVAEYKIPGTG